jgi:predicted kinase
MKLILMRGVSGSGKTTRAKKLQEQDPQAVILSTDDLFTVEGKYLFDPEKLGENHRLNRERCREHMVLKTRTIIIDNTNIQAWEMRPYKDLAEEHGYRVEIIEIPPPSLEELVRRQEARVDKTVPREALERMLERWRPLTIEEI